jgi:hypothetical protein
MCRRKRTLAILALVAGAANGCFSTDEGTEPPADGTLFFPVGLVASPGGNALFIVNSDFDLQFDAGSVQVFDLKALRDTLRPLLAGSTEDPATLCSKVGLGPNGSPLMQPGPCAPLGLTSFLRGNAKIGAFASDALFVCRPSADGNKGRCRGEADGARGPRARLFVPVRGDPSVTFFEVDDDRSGGHQDFALDCRQDLNSGRCDDSHRLGIDPSENTRGLTMPTEPFGLAATDGAEALVVTHQAVNYNGQTTGAVSLFTDRAETGNSLFDVKPVLQFVLPGIPAGANGIAPLPVPGVIGQLDYDANYQPGFLVTYRYAAQVDTFRFYDDAYASPARPFVSRTGSAGVSVNASGYDSRSIAIDTTEQSPRIACEIGCEDANAYPTAANRRDCMFSCASAPLGAYVANRSPASVLVGEINTGNPTAASEWVRFFDSDPLSFGPSRVVVGRVKTRVPDPDADPRRGYRTRVFVICFDARVVYVYDPQERRVEAVVRTGRGPHALAMDPLEPIAYLAHFTDSYIGVIDLDQSHVDTFGTIVASVGVPRPPRETK